VSIHRAARQGLWQKYTDTRMPGAYHPRCECVKGWLRTKGGEMEMDIPGPRGR
jgi:hypothetical protein